MSDDELVEKMAEAIVAAGYNPATAVDIARAATAVAEPVIRERCAVLCEELRHENWSSETVEWVEGLNAGAKAIRTGGTTT